MTIENPYKYQMAIERNILANAKKTWRNTYERHEEVEDAICSGRVYSDRGNFQGYYDNFLGSMARAFDTYGKLTEKQTEAVLRGIDKRNERIKQMKAQRAAENASSEWIGEVSKRFEIEITCRHVIVLEGFYGKTFIHLCADQNGNVIVYKGSSIDFPMKGETKTVRCTIKQHELRDGVKQTLIARPKTI